jgi:Tol biopolymer transport system component
MFYTKNRLAAFAYILLTLSLLAYPAPSATAAPRTPSTIAYVQGIGWDAIRLVEANGTNDRLLWSHGQSDPNDSAGFDPGQFNVLSLAWRPDGTEVAFASTHDRWCSLNLSDIFAVQADGQKYRRLTEAPACAALSSYAKGTVKIPVQNPYSSQFELSIYFQGAPAMQQIAIPPRTSRVVTFANVADLGVGVLQRAILVSLVDGKARAYGEETAVDVQAGGVVETAELMLDYPTLSVRMMHSPSWQRDGASLGYLLSYTSLYAINPNPNPLTEGELLVTGGYLPGLLSYAEHLRWGPTPEREDQLLYVGKDELANKGIYLVTVGSDSVGKRLIVAQFGKEDFLDLQWLPDGSGFLYALQEPATEVGGLAVKANLYTYSFATGRVTQLTDLPTAHFAGRFTIAPDGTQIVFERASGWGVDFITEELVDPDLWIMNRDGSNLRLLIENGRAPVWRDAMSLISAPSPTPGLSPTPQPQPTSAPSPTPEPSQFTTHIYLPVISQRR